MTTQLLERVRLTNGKMSETYQTTAVTKSKRNNDGDDNAFVYVKIYWRIETDPYTLIDEYFFREIRTLVFCKYNGYGLQL